MKIWKFFILVDFVVLDIEVDTKSLILGRPFLSTANENIDVRALEIQLNINGQKERFASNPRSNSASRSRSLRKGAKAHL